MFSYHHTAISVEKISETVEFYKKLGFNEIFTWNSEDQQLTIVHLKLGMFMLEVFCYENTDKNTSEENLSVDLKNVGVRHIALNVASIVKAKEYIEKLGLLNDIQITQGRTGILYFFLKDPNGIFVEIVEDKRGLL